MARLSISGILPQWEGDHDVDLSYFTNREWHQIRELCAVYPPDFGIALARRDAGLLVALAGVALQRDGFDLSREEWALLWDARSGLITLDLTVGVEEGADETPLPERDDSSDDESSSSGQGKSASSGENSENESASPATDPSATGDPG